MVINSDELYKEHQGDTSNTNTPTPVTQIENWNSFSFESNVWANLHQFKIK